MVVASSQLHCDRYSSKHNQRVYLEHAHIEVEVDGVRRVRVLPFQLEEGSLRCLQPKFLRRILLHPLPAHVAQPFLFPFKGCVHRHAVEVGFAVLLHNGEGSWVLGAKERTVPFRLVQGVEVVRDNMQVFVTHGMILPYLGQQLFQKGWVCIARSQLEQPDRKFPFLDPQLHLDHDVWPYEFIEHFRIEVVGIGPEGKHLSNQTILIQIIKRFPSFLPPFTLYRLLQTGKSIQVIVPDDAQKLQILHNQLQRPALHKSLELRLAMTIVL